MKKSIPLLSTILVGMLLWCGCSTIEYRGTAREVHLNRIFSEHMVLQRNRPIQIFGTATPGSSVAVVFDGQRSVATADADGNWQVTFPPRPAGGPYTLEVNGQDRGIRFHDVLVGDVWFCSGQSNMEMEVNSVQDQKREIAAADYPRLRLMTVPKIALDHPVTEPPMVIPWQPATPESVRHFSAAAYFFGRDLQRELNIPIGLIHSSWGGSPVEHWLPRPPQTNPEAIERNQKLAEAALPVIAEREQKLAECFAFERNFREMAKRSAVDYPDSDWPEMKLPSVWENAGHPGLDGIVQFRRTLELPAAWAGRDLELELGAIDETDVTYFNGVKIAARGSLHDQVTGYWQRPRHYVVPGKLVKAGKNVISIFVGDLHGEGGFWGKAPMRINPLNDPDAAIALEGDWKYQIAVSVPGWPRTEGNGYFGMVVPFFRFPIAGVIWYQGEANAGDPAKYLVNFPNLIRDWRDNWGYAFPFYFVQLANYTVRGSTDSWARLRDAQRRTLELVPNAGMAVALDIGDPKDIHPKNKQEVGRRLALLALKNTYGKELVAQGPLFLRAEFKDGKAIVHFRQSSSPLVARDGRLTGFELAGADGKFVPASAIIVGDTVEVSAPEIKEPAQVRYLWSDNPVPTLFNQEGLPASSFSTEELK